MNALSAYLSKKQQYGNPNNMQQDTIKSIEVRIIE